MINSKLFVSALILLGFTTSAFGAHHKSSENLTTFQQVFLKTYGGESEKLVSLAEAFSVEGYSWRPAEGIRSVREAILHVASANYFFGSMLGSEMPEGLNPKGFEKSITSRDETLKTLKSSIEFALAAVKSLNEETLNEQIDLFGSESPRMAAVMILGGHTYEHLGQLIAYARSSDVVPPWSQ